MGTYSGWSRINTYKLVLGLLLVIGAPTAGRTQGPETEGEPRTWWIGLRCVPLGSVSSAVIPYREGFETGLVIEEVLADSPAAKQGLQPGDVIQGLYKWDILQPIRHVGQLRDAIQRAGEAGEILRLAVLQRDEQGLRRERTVELKPVPEPSGMSRAWGLVWIPPGADALEGLNIELLQQLLREGRVEEFKHRLREWLQLAPRPGNRWFRAPPSMIGGGFVVPPASNVWPHEAEVHLSVQPGQPPRVRVRQGDREWEVPLEQVQSIPEIHGLVHHAMALMQQQLMWGTWGVAPSKFPYEPPQRMKPSSKVPEQAGSVLGDKNLPNVQPHYEREAHATKKDLLPADKRQDLVERMEKLEREIQELRKILNRQKDSP